MNVRELFGNISGTYDLLNRVLSFGTDMRWRKKGISLLPHGRHLRVLDLASGTMDLALQYLKDGAGEVTCLDFALPMLLTGRLKISPTFDTRLQMVCGNSLSLPFPDRHFDAAMCAWGMRNFPDLPRCLSEVRRVLKPGGSLLVIEFFKPDRTFSRIFSQTYGRYVLPTLGRWISKNPDAYDYLHRSIRGFLKLWEFEHQLEKAGFEIIVSKDLSGGIASLVLANVHAYDH